MPEIKAAAVAKITRPSYLKILDRKRLFSLLDRCRKRQAVWIAGPPGSGKTVLVSSYIEKKGLPAIWYQVDPGDSDAATFFYYMRLAAQKAVPRKKTRLPLLTPEYIPGIRAFTKRFFEGLYATVKTPFCLVFDNYQEVAAGSPFHRIIKDGLDVVPESVSVIFLSRSGPPAEFTRLRVSGAMEVVGRDELNLTAEEARAITRIKSGPAVTKQAASEMHKRTEGWAAGLILMLEQVKKGGAGIEDFKEMTPKAIFDYFLSEIFQNMDDDTRTVLLKTAFLPDMDSRTAEKLTRLPGAGEILLRLNRNNYFTERRFQANPVYQYHPLFKEFLLAKARETFTGAEIVRLLREAAEILEGSAKYEDAFKLLRDAGDWEGVARLIVSHAGSLVSHGRWAVLETWIRSVPPETLSGGPWLRYWLGVCGMQTNPDGARKDFEAAYGIFADEGTDVAGIFLSWCGAVNTFLYAWRDYHPLDGWIARFEGLRKRYGEPLPVEIEDNIAACVFGALMFRQPSHPDLPVWEERVKQILHRSKDEAGRMSVGHNLILYYLWTGRNSKAGLIIETLSPAFKGLRAPPLAELMWHFSRALYYYHMALYRDALRSVEEGLRLAERTGVRLVDAMLFGAGVLSSIPLNDIDGAARFLGKMNGVLKEQNFFGVIFFHHLASLVALNRGDTLTAVEHARTSWKMSDECGGPFIQNIMHYGFTYTLLEAGKYRSVARRIEEVRSLSRRTKSALMEYACLLLESLLAMKTGDEKTFLNRLGKAMKLGSARGIRFYTLLLHSSSSMLCARALKEGFEPEYVKAIIRANNLAAPDPEAEGWPWRLRVHALGGFEIYRDDAKVEFSGKAQKKPLDLLKAVIAMGGRDVREEKLTDALWPEAEGDAAHRAFATTLHRLRALLVVDGAIQLREGMVSLDGRRCRVDVWEFERALEKVDERVKKPGCSDGTEGLLEKALGLYRGNFLPSESEKGWTAPMRENLRGKLLRHIRSAGVSLEEAGEFPKAVVWFQAGIELDPLAEELYRHLMVSFTRLGQRSDALAAYEQLKKNLFSRIGLQPSLKTRSVYKSIFLAS